MSARGRSANPGWLQEGIIRGHMLGKTMLPGDEELGKKDDDHRFAPARRSSWPVWNHTFRWRRKRTLLLLVGLAVGYMVLSSFGAAGLSPLRQSAYDPPSINEEPSEPTGIPASLHIHKGASPRTYDGEIRFYRLKSSIREAAARTNGYDASNRNVLFAASSLKSAATLLPMVCEMSKWSRNHVHMAFMGREDIPLPDLLDINGIDRQKCSAVWHDARSDYMEYSSDMRLEQAVAGALSHFQSYLHPQAVIMDDSISEHVPFVRGMRQKTEALEIPLIEVPKDKADNFMWIARLDAGSLHHWHLPTIDILVQVPSESSSVLRLLKSIKDADYKGLKPPRITLELPAQLDESVKRHIESFEWPPRDAQASPLKNGGLSIRRRIVNRRATQEDAAIRFLELFYPASTTDSHILLLSPQAQLSPLFFHYVRYLLLEYKYSKFGSADSDIMMGVSLELPSVLLDGKNELKPPSIIDMYTSRYEQLYPKTQSAPFLWQAPNSHAALYFGNKWAELHSFLRNRVVKHQDTAKGPRRKKLVSEVYPAWTEYMLEFMRARCYSLLYPAKSFEAFVTVHNELYHVPEEFVAPSRDPQATPISSLNGQDEAFLRAESPVRAPKNLEPPIVPAMKSLHLALPFDGDLPEVLHLPQLLYNGTLIAPANASTIAQEYANLFRKDIGGCTIPKGKQRKAVPGEAKDLFCFGDEDQSDWNDDITTTSDAIVMDDPVKSMVQGEDEVPKTANEVVPSATETREPVLAQATVVADEPDEF